MSMTLDTQNPRKVSRHLTSKSRERHSSDCLNGSQNRLDMMNYLRGYLQSDEYNIV